jgi:hypothetical protein
MTEAMCPLCNDNHLSTDHERAMTACRTCARTLGIIAMPPSRRPPAPCARCNGRQFVRVIPREYTTTRVGELNEQLSVPMYVTHAPTLRQRGWIDKYVVVDEVEVEKTGYGLLETYICRKCGAVEWYCVDVERIPIDPRLMSQAIDYDSDSPYR